MNRTFASVALATCLWLLTSPNSYSQNRESRGKWGFGLNVGGQRLYGDLTNVSIGIGFEGLASYRFLKFADVALALGYNQLKFAAITTDFFNADIKGNFEIVSKGTFRPYVSLGAGTIGKSGVWEAAFIGGGGFRFLLDHRFALAFGADYRHTTTDALDGTLAGKSKDGYLNVRAGLSYYLPSSTYGAEEIIANESAPFFEVANEGDPFEEQQQSQSNPELETKNMEEYVKLKSRIDELNLNMNSKDQEIQRLQSRLNERRKTLALLEKKAAGQRSVSIPKTSSMSGFNEIYQQALINYYNKNYAEAVSLLRLLIKQYPDHELVSHCQYWIGRNLFALNQFKQAADEITKVLAFEHSSKKDEALLLLGKTYLKLGTKENAKEAFNRLLRECPNSELTAEARDSVQKL
jgi:TolA-binding protein